MTELSHETVVELLRHHGLSGTAFDLTTVATSLSETMDSAATLETLLGVEPVDDPTSFTPRWV